MGHLKTYIILHRIYNYKNQLNTKSKGKRNTNCNTSLTILVSMVDITSLGKFIGTLRITFFSCSGLLLGGGNL